MKAKVIRIDTLLKERFNGKIDMSDVNTKNYDDCFLSRAICIAGLMLINDIHDDDAIASITDGRDDCGIDGIFINKSNKTITIIQGKHHYDGKKTISSDDLLKLKEGIFKLLNSEYSSFNEKIKSMSTVLNETLTRDDYKIVISIVYTGGELNTTQKNKLSKLVKEIGEDICSSQIINLDKLYDYVVVNRFKESINLEGFKLYKLNHFLEPLETYYGLMDARDLVELYKANGNRIFSSNIRYYKGDTAVNEGMIDVLKNDKSNFILYNNGIKAICSSVSRPAAYRMNNEFGIFNIKDFSIVNGAQTTGVLSTFNDEELDGVKVFVTLISLENSMNKDEMGNKITTLSNTQNKIEYSDFVSLDITHKNLKSELQADGKDYIYVNGDQIENENQFITLYNLTFALCCEKSIELTSTIKNGYSRVFKNMKAKPYTSLFNNNLSHIFAWNITKIYEVIVKKLKVFSSNKESLDYSIPTHGVHFISHIIYCILNNRQYDFSKEYIKIDAIEDFIDEAIIELIPVIKNGILEKFTDEIVPNIFRTKKKAIILKEYVMDNLKTTEKLTIDESINTK